jgi:hypothetical protein
MALVPRRSLASVVRTIFYGSTAGAVAGAMPESVSAGEAFLLGALMMDFFTWVFWTLLHLPGRLWMGCYDTLLAIAFASVLYHHVPDTATWEGEVLATGFAGCMFGLFIKMIYYGYRHLDSMTEEGCY